MKGFIQSSFATVLKLVLHIFWIKIAQMSKNLWSVGYNLFAVGL